MKRIAKIAVAVLIPMGLVGGYLATGFYILPAWLKHNLPALIKKETGLDANLSGATFNPITLQLQLKQFEIPKMLRFETLDVQILWRESLKTKSLIIENITLNKPFLNLEKHKNGTLNIDVFLPKSDAPPSQNNDVFPLTIKHFNLSQGQFSFQDGNIQEDIAPLNFTLTNFSTQNSKPAAFILNANLKNGGELNMTGDFQFSKLASTGKLTFQKIALPHWLAFIPENKIKLTGEGELSANYHVAFNDKTPLIQIQNGAISLTNLKYDTKNSVEKMTLDAINYDSKTELVQLKNITLTNVNYDKKITAEKLTLDDLKVDIAKEIVQLKNVTLAKLRYENKITLQTVALDNLNFDNAKQQIQLKSLAFNTFSFTEKLAQLNVPSLVFNDLSFNLQTEALQTAGISLKDAELFDTTQNTLLFKLPSIDLNKLAFDMKKKTVAFGAIQAKNADFKAWLNPNGELNYQTLLPEDEAQVATEKKAGNSNSEAFWGIKIESVELADFSASFEDKTLLKPMTISIKPLSLKLTELSNAVGAKLPFELNTGINNSGSLHLKGNAGLSPLTAQTQIDVNALGLEKFQSYVDKFAHIDVIKGVFNLDGKLDVARGEQGELDVKFTGNTGIARLIVRDQIQNKDLVKWDNLTLKNIDADVLAQRYSATSLLLDKPYARVVIAKDKTLNFADILINAPVNKDAKTIHVKQAVTPEFHFKLDSVQISNGSSSFADFSMILPFSAEIKGLEGDATGISSDHQSTINVILKGNAYDLSPVDIKGKIQPYIGDYKAALNFKGMPLPLMSAYMAEFAGYKLEKGKMSIGMNYEVEKGELTATNNLLIEQFELGEKVENPHAIDAPLDLAIALLKDMNGIIKLDVPITGSLNNPNFDFGSIVSDAVLNLMTKTITSPFQAIAGLLGTNEDLSAVQFSAGEPELSESQKPKLDGLAKVLREREMLKLEIKGTAFESQDWVFLREEALVDRLKTLKSEEINRKGGQKILPEYVELDEADSQRLLAQEFNAKFPQLVKKSFLGNFELTKPEMGEFYTVAKNTLLGTFPVEQKRLTKLAAARARAIAKYIVQHGGVPNERVFILDTAVNPSRTDNDIDALLYLKVD